MSRPELPSLQIPPDPSDPALAQQQTRFNALLQELAQWRATLADWKDRIARYHQAVGPVHAQLRAAWREWVFALDEASLQPGRPRAERAQLGELLREAAASLLEWGDDAELAAVAARHGGEEAAPAPLADGLPDEAAAAEAAAPDWEQQAEAAAARRAAWAAQRRAASAARRRAQQAQEVSGSLRDVYRRLASALHPDREPDAQQRARKTALMQQANQAYAQENLLALLELQLQAEQIDAARLASVGRQRLAHYVAVLQEQLAELQAETRRLEAEFRAATGLNAGTGLQPRKADRAITACAQRLREDLQLLRLQTRALREGTLDLRPGARRR